MTRKSLITAALTGIAALAAGVLTRRVEAEAVPEIGHGVPAPPVPPGFKQVLTYHDIPGRTEKECRWHYEAEDGTLYGESPLEGLTIPAGVSADDWQYGWSNTQGIAEPSDDAETMTITNYKADNAVSCMTVAMDRLYLSSKGLFVVDQTGTSRV